MAQLSHSASSLFALAPSCFVIVAPVHISLRTMKWLTLWSRAAFSDELDGASFSTFFLQVTELTAACQRETKHASHTRMKMHDVWCQVEIRILDVFFFYYSSTVRNAIACDIHKNHINTIDDKYVSLSLCMHHSEIVRRISHLLPVCLSH